MDVKVKKIRHHSDTKHSKTEMPLAIILQCSQKYFQPKIGRKKGYSAWAGENIIFIEKRM